MVNKISKVMLRPAKCGLDLGDGSERAEYVDQDYILQTLGRPHRNINIMYTYYPKDGRKGSVKLAKIWKFIFNGIILMMIIFHMKAVSEKIPAGNHLNRSVISEDMDRMLH